MAPMHSLMWQEKLMNWTERGVSPFAHLRHGSEYTYIAKSREPARQLGDVVCATELVAVRLFRWCRGWWMKRVSLCEHDQGESGDFG